MKKDKKDVVALIKHWSEVFDLPILPKEDFPKMERAKLALDLIDEEFLETAEAVGYRDLQKVKDGLGDLLWVTVRAMMEFGIDPYDTIYKIYESNMSKADVNLENATITYKHYKEQGIDTYSREKDGTFITYRMSDNKVLKSHKFQEPKW